MAIPLLGGLIAAGGRALLGAAGRAGARLLGSGARKAVKTAVITGGGSVAGGGIKRVLGAGAGIAAGVAAEKVLGGGGPSRGVLPAAAQQPVMVGGVNLNPWADTRRKKYRRMNPLNPKALTRSIKRVTKFGEFAKQMGYSRPPACLKGFKGTPKRKRSPCR